MTKKLSITYAYDQNGKGGSEGNGGIKWYKWSFKRKLLEPFGNEFISKVDKKMKQKRIDSNTIKLEMTKNNMAVTNKGFVKMAGDVYFKIFLI